MTFQPRQTTVKTEFDNRERAAIAGGEFLSLLAAGSPLVRSGGMSRIARLY
jgi:hypothetical protein